MPVCPEEMEPDRTAGDRSVADAKAYVEPIKGSGRGRVKARVKARARARAKVKVVVKEEERDAVRVDFPD